MARIYKSTGEIITNKQKLFVAHYVSNGGNGTKAALAAGYSPKTAYSIANENLKKPEIVQEKDRLMSVIAEKVGLTAELTLSTIKECMELDKNEHASAVLKACELAGKHLKLFTDKIESEVSVAVQEDWISRMEASLADRSGDQ